MAAKDIEAVLRRVAGQQHGVAARAQLLAAGLAPHSLDRLVRTGRLLVLRRGVYQAGPVAGPRAREAAALLACGEQSRLSHGSAAALHGIGDPAPRDAVEVTVPRRRRLHVGDVRVHRVRRLLEDEGTVVDGLRVTTVARTLLDLAATSTWRQTEQALAAALRLRLVGVVQVRRLAARHPRHRGTARLRQALATEGGCAFTRSQAEEKLLELARSARLGRPELNVKVRGHEVDFLWRSARLVVEVDGFAFHASARAFVADRRRDAALSAAGYRVLRFTWADLTADRLATLARLAQALVHT